jgi:hypothetical protein
VRVNPDREALAVKQGKVSLNARGYGFSAVKLMLLTRFGY